LIYNITVIRPTLSNGNRWWWSIVRFLCVHKNCVAYLKLYEDCSADSSTRYLAVLPLCYNLWLQNGRGVK